MDVLVNKRRLTLISLAAVALMAGFWFRQAGLRSAEEEKVRQAFAGMITAIQNKEWERVRSNSYPDFVQGYQGKSGFLEDLWVKHLERYGVAPYSLQDVECFEIRGDECQIFLRMTPRLGPIVRFKRFDGKWLYAGDLGTWHNEW